MSSDVIISVDNLGKKYRISHQGGRQPYVALRDVIAQKCTAPFRAILGKNGSGKSNGCNLSSQKNEEDFWALKGVSFEVRRGDVVGIIGRNGAGKSTLLKILSRITDPTEGSVRLRGRVASLLEVGTGFHAELTGRENIFLNGAILGMSKAEIKRKFDEIVAFSEVEKFLDTPVKRYSSGMYVRLAFAVAAHLEPEILIVDEVLAVGDAEFQKKCLGKMQDVAAKEGRTVLFVSHNMGAVERLCRRGILIQKGRVDFGGDTRDVIKKYLAAFERPENHDLELETDRGGNGKVRLRKVTLFSDGVPTPETISGADASFEFAYTNPHNVGSAQLIFTIYTESGAAVTNIGNSLVGHRLLLSPGQGRITCTLPRLALNRGRYRVAVAIQDEAGGGYDHVSSAFWFNVVGSRFYATGQLPDPSYSPVLVEHRWI